MWEVVAPNYMVFSSCYDTQILPKPRVFDPNQQVVVVLNVSESGANENFQWAFNKHTTLKELKATVVKN